jgi:hypothetical protein
MLGLRSLVINKYVTINLQFNSEFRLKESLMLDLTLQISRLIKSFVFTVAV